MADAPKFKVDESKFKVEGGNEAPGQAAAIQAGVNDVRHDWSKVDASVNALGEQQGYFQDAAQGKNGAATAAGRTARGQEDLGASTHSPQSLAAAFAKIAKGGAAQAGEVGAADVAQKQHLQDQASQIAEFKTKTEMQKIAADSTLQSAQFAINEKLNQSMSGLRLAQQSLKNMMNHALSSAKNAGDLAQLQLQQASMQKVLDYVGMGVGAGSAVAAGMADQYSQSTQYDTAMDKAKASQAQGVADFNTAQENKKNGL